MTPSKLIIASRESALAMWQAEHIQARLQALYPECDVQILGMTTRGDQILDKTLSKIGGKGLFIKELEQALQEGRADLAVHSIKDVPMDLPQGFALAAIGERAQRPDLLVIEASGVSDPPRTLSARPGQNRDRGHRILRAPLNHPVAVDQIDQGIALLIEEPHHLHGLEHQRSALTKHLFTLFELIQKTDRP